MEPNQEPQQSENEEHKDESMAVGGSDSTEAWVARVMAFGFSVGRVLSLGLVRGPLTADQVKEVRRASGISDYHIILCAKLQKPLRAGRTVFRTLTFVTVG